jgi:hypothetical protein
MVFIKYSDVLVIVIVVAVGISINIQIVSVVGLVGAGGGNWCFVKIINYFNGLDLPILDRTSLP